MTLPVYRQQFAELEQDKVSGLLTDDQYQAARQELERRLLEETGTSGVKPVAGGPLVNVKAIAFVLVLFVPNSRLAAKTFARTQKQAIMVRYPDRRS